MNDQSKKNDFVKKQKKILSKEKHSFLFSVAMDTIYSTNDMLGEYRATTDIINRNLTFNKNFNS